MASMASIAKHPIHPMLIPFPIGLWVFSFLSDIIYRVGGNDLWTGIAYYTMLGGVIGAILAALPGLVDLFSMRQSKARQIGILHMGINVIAVFIFSIDLYLRREQPPGGALPLLLSFLGVVLITVSGWLGGEMVYVYGVAVEREKQVGPL